MVEWDLHPTKPARCLDTVVKLDHLIQRTANQMDKNSLVFFTADHSFDFRLLRGKKGADIVLPPGPNAEGADKDNVKADVIVGTHHSGEEVLIAAAGPGSQRVHGFMPNTELFHVMMSAYGWRESR